MGVIFQVGALIYLRACWKFLVNVTKMTTGVLLVGHGTRDKAGLAEVQTLAARVADAFSPLPWPVETGFIELAEPTIAGAFHRLVKRGVQTVRVVPLLLFAAGHAKTDLPSAIREAAEAHKSVQITIASPFGSDERIFLLSRRRFTEALCGRPQLEADETCWLLVGRGSSDAEATAEFGRFAYGQAQRLELRNFGCAFVAAARPTLEDGLERAAATAASGVKRIVVQPHLMFRGVVLDQVHAAVARWQATCPGIDWVTCAHLGPEQELVDAVVERATAPAAPRAGKARAPTAPTLNPEL
jgi:sirohydrochlorin cobaltochelatase